jgi:hypothetical protein
MAVSSRLCGKSQKTHLLAGGMNGKQGLGDAIPIKGFFPADVLHRRKIAPQLAVGFFTSDDEKTDPAPEEGQRSGKKDIGNHPFLPTNQHLAPL